LVRCAGGRVTDLNGNDIDPLTHQSFIVASTHPGVHEELLEMLHREGFADSKG
jgi:fructose-1,6-bisphosphatase/inositol monophosphatase family enzyme